MESFNTMGLKEISSVKPNKKASPEKMVYVQK